MVVVVDILRATTTMVTALSEGMRKVVPAASLSDCLAKKQRFPQAITAGELDGHTLPGLDMGNEPLAYTAEAMKGKTLILTTTNGTVLIEQALQRNAQRIIMGAFVNIGATARYLRELNMPVHIACAGWKHAINVEDTLYAGALCTQLQPYFQSDCDSVLLASELFKQHGNSLEFIQRSAHYKRLDRFRKTKDVAFCLQMDVYDCVVGYRKEAVRVLSA